MSEQSDVQLNETDAAAPPSAEASGQEATTSGVTRVEFDALSGKIDEAVAGLQGTKDKMVHSFDEAQKGFLDTLAAAGVPLDEGQKEALNSRIQEDDRIAEIVKTQVAAALGQTQGKAPEQANPLLDSIFRKRGIEPDSQDAIALAKKHNHDASQILLELETRPAQPVSAGSVVTPSGGSPPPSKEGKALAPEYIEKMTAAAGNRTELQRIKEEYREKGVPVDDVTWA